MSEDTICQMFSKDVVPYKIKMKDVRYIVCVLFLRTEGVASLQDGRKPGGVVNSSVR